WGGATVLRPDFRRGRVKLSRGGADATVVRPRRRVWTRFPGSGRWRPALPAGRVNNGWRAIDRPADGR
ncbi:hypothetical protein, partial [Polymorphospora rubra]|uniref:hypothetical protein n=1 Tax=Polymorphospora rubra TaxID=338584 RepID=UPI0033C5D6A2